jgi:hypothetical protein
VRDRRLERRFRRSARGIHVDPLTIAGGVGELFDACLGDLEPVADGDLLADALVKRTNVDVDHGHGGTLSHKRT